VTDFVGLTFTVNLLICLLNIAIMQRIIRSTISGVGRCYKRGAKLLHQVGAEASVETPDLPTQEPSDPSAPNHIDGSTSPLRGPSSKGDESTALDTDVEDNHNLSPSLAALTCVKPQSTIKAKHGTSDIGKLAHG